MQKNEIAPSSPQDPEDGHQLRMGFFEHLEELRDRLFRAFLALVIGTGIGFVVAEPVLKFLLVPYQNISPDEATRLLVLGPTGAVINYFRVALLVGGIIAVPIATYEILMFIIPGLTKKERRYVLSFMPALVGLFLTGIVFAWFVLMPPAISFLEGFSSDVFVAEWTAEEYLSFVTALLFWMGVAFELPLAMFVLSLVDIVNPRMLIQGWRVAIVGSAVAAAIITPTVDPVNMFLVMAPLLTLYAISIGLTAIGRRVGV